MKFTHPFRRFLQSSGAERQLVTEALFQLGRARWVVWAVPFRKIAKMLEKHPVSAGEMTERGSNVAEQVGWAVRSAARYTPWPSTCLVQSLAANEMLRRRQIESETHFGVGKHPETGEFEAHAWLLCRGAILTGADEYARYSPIAHFSSQHD